jgi:DNA-binding MarR family transcriptional regulator
MAASKRESRESRESREANKSSGTGRYAYEGLDRLIHERARLAILSSLASANESSGLTFNDLKDLCALTDGNLSRQLQLLKESGMVEIEKGTSGNRPQTICRLTRTGRKRFLEYIAELERVVSNATDVRTEPSTDPENGRGLSMA